jgi:hypothetical protein
MKIATGKFVAVVLLGAALACGSSSSSSGDAGTGGSTRTGGGSGTGGGNTGTGGGNTGTGGGAGACSGSGMPGGGGSACANCIQSMCSTEASCIESACSAYTACECACPQNDFNCPIGCLSNLQGPCQQCFDTIAQCREQKCSTECGSSNDDGGIPTFDGGIPTFDGGFPFGDGSATGACTDLKSCCAGIADMSKKQECDLVVTFDVDLACQQELMDLRDNGTCQ